MDLSQILLLALLQGFTEFLPISSSAHLILAPYFFSYRDQGLSFDVAVHLGSLIAVIIYFRRDVIAISSAWVVSLRSMTSPTPNSHLGWAILVATLPIIIVGFLLKSIIEGEMRTPWLIAVMTIAFGLVLAFADKTSKRDRNLESISLTDAVWIGLAQVLALVPGTSRSGITMTAALMLGLTRHAASRFSFLISIPTILASSLLVTYELTESSASVDWLSLGMGVMLSALAAYFCIHYFMRYIERVGMLPFVIYRILLGIFILTVLI